MYKSAIGYGKLSLTRSSSAPPDSSSAHDTRRAWAEWLTGGLLSGSYRLPVDHPAQTRRVY